MTWKRPRSFRRSLIINLLLMVLMFGVIMAGITYVAVHFSARRASEAMMTQVVDGVVAETESLYRSVESIFILVEFWARRTWNGGWDTYEFDKTFPPMLLAFYEASSVYLALGSGDFYMLSRADGRWISWTVRPVAWGERALVRSWSDDKPVPDERWQPLKFDVTQLPWFQGALARLEEAGDHAPLARRVFAATPAIAPATGVPGRALSMATRSPLGDPFVFCFEQSLVGVTEGLQQLHVLEGGRVATLSGDPATGSLLLTGVPISGSARDLAAAEALILQPPGRLGGPIAAFVTAAVGPGKPQPGTPVSFSSDGSAWWGMAKRVDGRAFDLPTDPSWIVATVPEQDLLRRLPDLGLALAAATTLALLVAMLRARSLAQSYSRPIDELVEHSRRMQRLDFERPTSVDTNIIEIGILGGTLEGMRRALHSYASISEETRIAEAIVRGTLPAGLRRPAGYEFEAFWRPAEETGGEVFDAVVDGADGCAETAALLLLDPDSFGVEAAVLSAQLRAVFRAAVRTRAAPTGITDQLQSCLEIDLHEPGVVRAWLGCLDAARGTVSWVAAGLDANMVHFRAATGEATIAESAAPAFGASRGYAYVASSLDLAPGDILAVVSNGVIDALDKNRQRLGLGWLQHLLVQHAASDAAAIVGRIDAAIVAFSAGTRVPADRTVLLLKRQ